MRTYFYWGCLVMIMAAALLLSGCGFKDIDKRFFVVSVGIDPAKGNGKKYLISLKFAVPTVEAKTSEFMIVSEEADSVAEAVRLIKTNVDKEVDFSHAKVVVYSNELVKEEMAPQLYYFFTRRRDFQKIAWVSIGKPSALEVLKVKPKFEQLPSNSLFLALGREGSETPYVIPEFLFEMKKRFKEKGLDPILPIIEAKKDRFEINQVGIFNKKRLMLSLSQEETKILNFFLGEEQKSAIKIHQGKKKFIIDTQKVNTKYKIDASYKSDPTITVDIKVKGRIEEASLAISNNNLAPFEKDAENNINSFVEKLLVKLQKADVDPIGFGLRYRSRHFNKNDWEEWKRMYPDIKFKVQTKVEIEDTGLVE